MTGKYDDRLADYVDVKERVKLLYATYPDARLVTDSASMSLDPDGIVRVWCKALAYRTADDPHPGVGWSYLAVPGSTPYTRGSEIENAETSAWGRAIGALGIGIDKSIASSDEVRTKALPSKKFEHTDDGGLVGVVEVGDKASSDFLLRQSPEGSALGFRLRAQGGILVECRGPLADQLVGLRESVVGQRVTVWGAISERSFTPKGKEQAVKYQVLAANRVRVPGLGDVPSDTPARVPAAPGPSETPVGDQSDVDRELLALGW